LIVPIINPTNNKVVTDEILSERNKIPIVVTNAPKMEAMTTIETSKKCNAVIAVTPPNPVNITKATPNDAPEEIPIEDGDANGFRKSVCNKYPATDKEIPAEIAESVLGILIKESIVWLVVATVKPPKM